MRLLSTFFVLALISAITSGCTEEEKTGAIRVFGNWDREVPEDSELKVAVVKCPFSMPPEYMGYGTIENGFADGTAEDVPVGEQCVVAFIDMDIKDGYKVNEGLDAVAVTPEGTQSFVVTVTENETTEIEVEFAISGEEQSTDEDTEMDEDDVWVELTVECSSCTSDEPVIFYGYEGDEMGTIPQIYNKFEEEISFPMQVLIKQTGPMNKAPFNSGKHIVSVYQDVLDNDDMKPEEGEPQSEPSVVELTAGALNKISLQMQ